MAHNNDEKTPQWRRKPLWIKSLWYLDSSLAKEQLNGVDLLARYLIMQHFDFLNILQLEENNI